MYVCILIIIIIIIIVFKSFVISGSMGLPLVLAQLFIYNVGFNSSNSTKKERKVRKRKKMGA
jgi:hypothetical protein